MDSPASDCGEADPSDEFVFNVVLNTWEPVKSGKKSLTEKKSKKHISKDSENESQNISADVSGQDFILDGVTNVWRSLSTETTDTWHDESFEGMASEFDNIVFEIADDKENRPLDLTRSDRVEDEGPELELELETSHNNNSDPEFCVSDDDQVEVGTLESSSRVLRPQRGRKRRIPTQTNAGSKILRNSNESYFTCNKKFVEKRKFQNFVCQRQYSKPNVADNGIIDLSKTAENEGSINQYCRLNCPTHISEQVKEKLFNEFWSLGDYNSQNLFISANVIERPKEREYKRTNANTAKRKQTKVFARSYCLNGIAVCKETFLKTLQISSKRVDTALRKSRELTLKDQRGKPQGGVNAITPEQKEKVRQHIEQFPRYKSHYRRSHTDNEFLAPEMSLIKMYELYCEEVIEEKDRDQLVTYRNGTKDDRRTVIRNMKCVSLSTYKRIFHSDFNLKFKSLKKDTCAKCDSFNAQLLSATGEARKKIEAEQEKHFQAWQAAREEMKKDMLSAKETPTLEVLTFDLEKTLPLPRLPSNIVFYKRQLWVYNSGVHSCKQGQGYFYVWCENQAGRGAQEVGSALLKHAEKNLSDLITELILWCDSCGGQNRNIKIVLLLKALLEQFPSLKVIIIKYLVPGHTYLPNDQEFSDVESALKFVQRLYVPEDYVDIMKKARSKNPFIVTKMEANDFHSSANLEKIIVNRREVENGEPDELINWFTLREIKIERSEPLKFYCRTDFTSEYKVVSLEKKRGKKVKNPSFSKALKPLWPNGKSVAPAKLNDLKSMLHLIPQDSQSFYENINSSPEIVDDLHGINCPPDYDYDQDEDDEDVFITKPSSSKK